MSEASPQEFQQEGCIIRRAMPADAPAIRMLYGELVSDPAIQVLPEQIVALSESLTSFLLVIESNKTVCGTLLLTVCPDVMYGSQPFAVIENVVVTQTRRGGGIGRLLLGHAERLALQHDCTKIMLLSGASRETAHSFFRGCGFSSDTKHAFVKYRRQFSDH